VNSQFLGSSFYRAAQLCNVEEIATETDCQANYVRKGISMACFYYARCLDKQLGIKNYKELAKQYYSKVGQVKVFCYYNFGLHAFSHYKNGKAVEILKYFFVMLL